MIADLLRHPARAATGTEPALARADRLGHAGRARSVRDDLDHGRPARESGKCCGISVQVWFSENRSLPTNSQRPFVGLVSRGGHGSNGELGVRA
jgi:hypothetical protein